MSLWINNHSEDHVDLISDLIGCKTLCVMSLFRSYCGIMMTSYLQSGCRDLHDVMTTWHQMKMFWDQLHFVSSVPEPVSASCLFCPWTCLSLVSLLSLNLSQPRVSSVPEPVSGSCLFCLVSVSEPVSASCLFCPWLSASCLWLMLTRTHSLSFTCVWLNLHLRPSPSDLWTRLFHSVPVDTECVLQLQLLVPEFHVMNHRRPLCERWIQTWFIRLLAYCIILKQCSCIIQSGGGLCLCVCVCVFVCVCVCFKSHKVLWPVEDSLIHCSQPINLLVQLRPPDGWRRLRLSSNLQGLIFCLVLILVLMAAAVRLVMSCCLAPRCHVEDPNTGFRIKFILNTSSRPIRSQSQLSIITSSNNWFKPNWSETWTNIRDENEMKGQKHLYIYLTST